MTEDKVDVLATALHAKHAEEFDWMNGTELSEPVPVSECGNCQRWGRYAASLIDEAEAAERERTRKSLGAAWSAFLDLLMDARLDDGTPVIDVVLATNPELRMRLVEGTYRTRGPAARSAVWAAPTDPESDPVHRPGRKR